METQEQTKYLLPPLKRTILQLVKEFDTIPAERIKLLRELASFVTYKINEGDAVKLLFVCTHNSRRSHISQVWAKAASYFYGVDNVQCYSAGTESTAFNVRAVQALRNAGFGIVKIKEGENPLYSVMYAEEIAPLKIFSKRLDHPENPKEDFAAIMTCTHADENCPVISGASLRLSLPYHDPKDFDDTPEQDQKYAERVHQIGREMLYVFSQIR